jgi:hypothetical protein
MSIYSISSVGRLVIDAILVSSKRLRARYRYREERCRLEFKDLGRRQCAISRTGGLVASHTTLSSFVIVKSCIYI